jgi:DNA invertase Pin-like site-specific DNA recombinase
MMQVGKGCKRISYVRVSSEEQNEARQVEAMAGQHIDRTFMDKLSGKDTQRPQLMAAWNSCERAIASWSTASTGWLAT